jgi:hypothetical protein
MRLPISSYLTAELCDFRPVKMLATLRVANTTLALVRKIYGVIMPAINKIAMGVCLLLLTAACAAAQPASPKPGASGKSVCVASALGQRYDVQTIGLMVFGNNLQSVSVESWGVDEMVARKIGAILSNRFAVRRISFPKGFSDGTGGLFNNNDAERFTALRGAAGATKCNFFIVVTKSGSQYSGTNQNLIGLGVLHHDAVIASGVFAFAYVSVRLYDNATLTSKGTPLNFGDLLEHGLRKIDRANWPATPQAAVQSAVLRDAALSMVARELTEKVPKLFE